MAARIYHLCHLGALLGLTVFNTAAIPPFLVLLLDSFALTNKLGVPSVTLISLLPPEAGLLRSLVHRVKERMKYADFEGGMSVTNARKDSCLALATAQQMGVPLFAISASHTPYEIAEANGLGDADYAALSRLWEEWAHVIFKEADKP